MVAQQAALAHLTRQNARTPGQRRTTSSQGAATIASRGSQSAGAGLPTAVADRIASLFADDPGLAEAVSAHLPAARQASARDLAVYAHSGRHRTAPRIIETVG